MNHRSHVESLERRCLFSAALTAADVSQIISQAAAVSLPSQTIVVVDTNGDVLGIYGQAPNSTNQDVSPSNLSALETVNAQGQLSGALGPSTAAKFALINAVAEARTAAFFESTQDAFTTRTARFIVQNDFPQPISNTEAGPLLGVEFSNAAGTDALPAGIGTGLLAGLSGNPGGVPLFIDGQPVGGIGVAGSGSMVAARQDLVPQPIPGAPMADQSPAYKSDPTGAYYTGSEEYSFDEAVALAGEEGYAPSASIEANTIFINGLALPYTAEDPATGAPPSSVPGLTDNGEPLSALPARAYFAYAPFGKVSSGPIGALPTPYPSTTITETNGTPITINLKNNSPAAGGLGINPAIAFNNDASKVPDVTNGVVSWTLGNFGFLPGADAPGTTIHLTKADELQITEQAFTEALSIRAAIREPADVPAQVHVAITDLQGNILTVSATPDATNFSFDVAVQKARTAGYFSNNTHAFSSRAIGFLADSTLPPAIENGVTGPLYQLQESLGLPQNESAFTPQITEDINGTPTVVPNPLGDGITIFPGGVPLYIDGQLVGAVGISGDGVDQDDLIDSAAASGFAAASNIQDDSLSSTQIVNFITKKINELNYVPPAGADYTAPNGLVEPDPHFTFLPVSFLQSAAGIDDPDMSVGNPDGIVLSSTDTIIDRILKRLAAEGVDSVNLPYQKFPRNPGL
jgi:uncharacterized protein GlcG (DUF336 family)